MQIVEVIWDDAYSSSSEMSVKKALKAKPVRTHTVAFLLAENDAGVTLTTDRYPDDPKTGKLINFIPWSIIVSYWVFKDA